MMYEAPPDHEILLKTRQRKKCLESRLVLTAAGIAAEAVYRDGWWYLIVHHYDLEASLAELEAYRQENPDRLQHRAPKMPTYGGAVAAVLVYAGLILGVAILTDQRAYGWDWLAVGRMQAGEVMNGQGWRIVTALTLHLDGGHIAGNLVFGAVFGLLAGQALGGGVAWLGILLAGALGNWVNALVQAPEHTSIGASTAVFAALGMLVSHTLRQGRSLQGGSLQGGSLQESLIKRWSPLIGGVVLLAFTGVGGERTDVVAHLTGFLAGLLLGWLAGAVPARWLASDLVQCAAALATIAIVTSAWIAGLILTRV